MSSILPEIDDTKKPGKQPFDQTQSPDNRKVQPEDIESEAKIGKSLDSSPRKSDRVVNIANPDQKEE